MYGTDKARQKEHSGTDTQAVFPHNRGGKGILRLYEKTYYEEVIKVCQRNIEIIDSLHEQTIKMSEDDKA